MTTQESDVLSALFENYPALAPLRSQLESSFSLLSDCHDKGGLLLTCGNGGSAADADHIVGELMKGFLLRRPLKENQREPFSALPDGPALSRSLQGAIPAICLNAHSALLSAYANDVSPEYVFAQQVFAYGQNRPALLLALSTSGNSANVVRAAETARAMRLPSIGITGAPGGRLAELCTVCIRLPATETYRVQELTLPVYHALCAMLELKYFAPEPH